MRLCTKGHAGEAHLPPWHDPKTKKIYDKVEEPGKPKRWRTWWQWYVETRGESVAWADRNLWLDGMMDVRGNWWCGFCLPECKFINQGDERGYPDAQSIYSIAPHAVGYEAWLKLAIEQSGCMVATLSDILAGRIKVRPYEQRVRVQRDLPDIAAD